MNKINIGNLCSRVRKFCSKYYRSKGSLKIPLRNPPKGKVDLRDGPGVLEFRSIERCRLFVWEDGSPSRRLTVVLPKEVFLVTGNEQVLEVNPTSFIK